MNSAHFISVHCELLPEPSSSKSAHRFTRYGAEVSLPGAAMLRSGKAVNNAAMQKKTMNALIELSLSYHAEIKYKISGDTDHPCKLLNFQVQQQQTHGT